MRVLLLLRDELDLWMGLNYKTDQETINGHYAANSSRTINDESHGPERVAAVVYVALDHIAQEPRFL